MKNEKEKREKEKNKTTFHYVSNHFDWMKLELMKNGRIFRFSWEILDQDFCEKELSTGFS